MSLTTTVSPPALPVLTPAPPAGYSTSVVAPRLEIPPYDLSCALVLERELAISHVLAQVLVRRGLGDPESAREFLDPRETHEPGAFAGMSAAVASIERHLRAGSRIVVHGDYDVDGICATAVLLRALRSLGADVGWFLPHRLSDGYGLSAQTIQRLASRGVKLLVTVDCGVSAVAEVAAAQAAGLDVVISDHHEPRPDGQLPGCPIVHPTVGGYPCRDLCGTGVAYKLAQALGAGTADEDIDLVALATVADLVALTGENRRLVRQGLGALANTAKPGPRALLEVARCDPSALDAHALGFRLAPRINAAGRLARPDAGLELLLTDDPGRAREIAAELDAVNVERRAVEQRIGWEAEAQVAELGDRRFYVLAGREWHPGVIGIVASRVVERHHRPTILISLDGEPATGSGRSIPGFDLLAALHYAADHMQRYGGHRAAAGMTIRGERVPALREAIEGHAERMLTEDLLTPRERVDAVVSGSELHLWLAEELARIEPCGAGNPRPRLLVPGARLEDLRAMGEGRHARFSVASGGARARAVAFGCDGRLTPIAGRPLDATFALERNAWNGAVEARAVLRQARLCGTRSIEIVGEPDEYLSGVLAELDRPLETDPPQGLDGHATSLIQRRRVVLDRHGESPLAVLADASAAAAPVLAVCAEAHRRVDRLRERAGGFALTSYHALERAPALTEDFASVVALDPPSGPVRDSHLRTGAGFTHLCWAEAELRFAQQVHELEYGLRASLVTLYRELKIRGSVTGEELERLLRGDGPYGRPACLAGRLIRVLVELELVSLDRDLPALTVASGARTELERSPAYRVYARRYEDGRRYLSSEKVRAGG